MSAIVRFIDGPMPHGETYPPDSRIGALWQKWRGRELVVGRTLPPRPGERCDTDILWEIVGPQELLDEAAKGHSMIVCRHQIQAGD